MLHSLFNSISSEKPLSYNGNFLLFSPFLLLLSSFLDWGKKCGRDELKISSDILSQCHYQVCSLDSVFINWILLNKMTALRRVSVFFKMSESRNAYRDQAPQSCIEFNPMNISQPMTVTQSGTDAPSARICPCHRKCCKVFLH